MVPCCLTAMALVVVDRGGQGEGVGVRVTTKDGNRSRQMFLFTPIYPDSSGDSSGSGHGVDGGVWSWLKRCLCLLCTRSPEDLFLFLDPLSNLL